MTNRMWVTLHIFLKGILIIYYLVAPRILNPSMTRKWVTLQFFLKGGVITSCLMTHREWAILYILNQSHHILSFNQKLVSDIAHLFERQLIQSSPMTNRKWVMFNIFLKGSLITSCLMANREWVTCTIFWKVIPSHLVLWLTESEWHCAFNIIKCGLITCMTNRWWTTLHIFSERQPPNILSYG